LDYFSGIEDALQGLGGLIGVGEYVDEFVDLFNRLKSPVEQISDSLGQIIANLDQSVNSLTTTQGKALDSQDTVLWQYNYRP